MSYVVLARFRARPGQAPAFERLMAEHARRSREEEPGCLAFDLCRDETDAALFLLYEVYRDAAAYADHRADPRHAAILRAIAPLVVEREDSPFVSRDVLVRLSPPADAAPG